MSGAELKNRERKVNYLRKVVHSKSVPAGTESRELGDVAEFVEGMTVASQPINWLPNRNLPRLTLTYAGSFSTDNAFCDSGYTELYS